MSQPIFPKGIKVVKGKVVQRKLPTSRMAEFKLREKSKIAKKFDSSRPTNDVLTGPETQAYKADLTEAIRKTLTKNRTGPRLAPGQQSTPKTSTQRVFEEEAGIDGEYLEQRNPLGDPRQQRELPKVRPGRPRPVLPERREAFVDANDSPMSPDDAPPTYLGGAKASDIRDRRKNPKMEGRGASPLAKIIEAMEGQKMPAPLLQQLKGLDPAKLEEILALINQSKKPSVRKKYNQKLSLDRAPTRQELEDSYNSPDDLPF